MTSQSMLGQRQIPHCPNAHAVEQAKRSLNGRNPKPARGSQVSWKNATIQTSQALHTLKETLESQVSRRPMTSVDRTARETVGWPYPKSFDFSLKIHEFASVFLIHRLFTDYSTDYSHSTPQKSFRHGGPRKYSSTDSQHFPTSFPRGPSWVDH